MIIVISQPCHHHLPHPCHPVVVFSALIIQGLNTIYLVPGSLWRHCNMVRGKIGFKKKDLGSYIPKFTGNKPLSEVIMPERTENWHLGDR